MEVHAYPSFEEKSVIEQAEKWMREVMGRYDPSHDAYHGTISICLPINLDTDQV